VKPLLRILHHRSLTTSIICLFLSLFAVGLFPGLSERLREPEVSFLVMGGVTAGLGILVCILNLWLLIRDNLTGYPAMRCSVATLVWAFACLPFFALAVVVVRNLVTLQ
jgi:hypothetical protein